MPCPCQSGQTYQNCCGPFLEEKAFPETPEQLMRSRYTAFTQANMDYLAKTMQGEPLIQFNAKQTEQWAKSVEWLGLEVYQSGYLKNKINFGTVSFRAMFSENGQMGSIEENSLFSKINGRWYYTGAHKAAALPAQKSKKPSLGRNEPCSCQSGLKYKKCCGK